MKHDITWPTKRFSFVTGRFAGGLRADLKRRAPLFCSDWTDAFVPENLQKSVSTILYLFIAAIAPAITFPSSTCVQQCCSWESYEWFVRGETLGCPILRGSFWNIPLNHFRIWGYEHACGKQRSKSRETLHKFASQGLVADSWMARTVSLECWRWSCLLPSVASCLLRFQGSRCPFLVPLVLS